MDSVHLEPIREDARSRVTKDDYQRLAGFRSALSRFLRFSEDAAAREGLTPRQHQLLLAIKGRPARDWATVSELSQSLLIRHNTAVELVNRSVAAGLVKREQRDDDRRGVKVMLTPLGEELIAHLSSAHLEELGRLQAALHQPL